MSLISKQVERKARSAWAVVTGLLVIISMAWFAIDLLGLILR